MELQEKILDEAQRLHRIEQKRLIIDAMCCIELVAKRNSNSGKKQLARAYVSQASTGKCVLLLEKALDVVVDCSDDALEALAADWAQSPVATEAQPYMYLLKASGWQKESKSFSKKSQLLEATLAKGGADGNCVDKEACLQTLHRFIKFVRALRPSVKSPFS